MDGWVIILFCGIPTGHLDEGYWQIVMSNREVFKLTEAQIDRKEVALTRFFIFRIAIVIESGLHYYL